MIFGVIEKPELAKLQDLSGREIAILAPLVVLVIYYGVHPGPILDGCAASVAELVKSTQSVAAAVKSAALAAH